MNNSITVIIPTKNEEPQIKGCLKSIKDQSVLPTEIIVVDNHSADATVKLAKALGAKVFIAGPERSSQRNFGAEKAKGKFLFFVDADMTLEKKVFEQAAKTFQNNPGLVALIVPEISIGKNYWAKVKSLERRCYLGEEEIEAARIFKKDAFFKAGGYDRKMIAGEDWDLHNRIKKMGQIGRIKAKIIHREGRLSLRKYLVKKYYYAKNISPFARVHPRDFSSKSGLTRIKIFLKNWRILLREPLYVPGVLILKMAEYFIFLLSRIK